MNGLWLEKEKIARLWSFPSEIWIPCSLKLHVDSRNIYCKAIVCHTLWSEIKNKRGSLFSTWTFNRLRAHAIISSSHTCVNLIYLATACQKSEGKRGQIAYLHFQIVNFPVWKALGSWTESQQSLLTQDSWALAAMKSMKSCPLAVFSLTQKQTKKAVCLDWPETHSSWKQGSNLGLLFPTFRKAFLLPVWRFSRMKAWSSSHSSVLRKTVLYINPGFLFENLAFAP